MSVVKTVGKGIAWNTSAMLFGKVVVLANIFIILRSLSVYEYGFSELVMSIISTVGIFLLPGLVNTIIADLSVERGRENLTKMKLIFQQYFLLNIVMGVVAWAVLFFGSQPVAAWAGNEYAAQFLQIASFLFLISPLRTITQTLAIVMMRFFDQSFYTVFEELWKLAFLLTFVVWQGMGIRGLMYAIVFSQLMVVLLYLPRTLSAYREFSSAQAEGGLFFWNLVREHRKWSVAASYVGTITQNLRLWIIKAMLGTEAVGLFAFAYGIMGNVASLVPVGTVLTAIVPHYVDKRDQFVRIVRASIKVQILVTLALMGAVAVSIQFFTQYFFPHYLPAVPLVYIILLSIIPNGVAGIFTLVFSTFKQQKSLFFSNVIKLFLLCVVMPPSILIFGLKGTVVELVVSGSLHAIERYVRLRRFVPEFQMSLRDTFSPDAYEQEAMGTVRQALRYRMPAIWPFNRL